MKASAVLAIVDDLLQDEDAIRWTPELRMRLLNESQLAVVSVRPDAKTVTQEVTLAAGVSQTLPAGALRLQDVKRNKNGRGITLVSREVMNDLTTNWYTAANKPVVKHYAHDPRAPRDFDVYPPAEAGVIVLASFTITPTNCSGPNDDIDLDDTYAPAMANWICHRAFLRDAESPFAAQRAASYLGSFQLLLTGKTSADASITPAAAQATRMGPKTL